MAQSIQQRLSTLQSWDSDAPSLWELWNLHSAHGRMVVLSAQPCSHVLSMYSLIFSATLKMLPRKFSGTPLHCCHMPDTLSCWSQLPQLIKIKDIKIKPWAPHGLRYGPESASRQCVGTKFFLSLLSRTTVFHYLLLIVWRVIWCISTRCIIVYGRRASPILVTPQGRMQIPTAGFLNP